MREETKGAANMIRPPKVHPQPSELAAQAWLQSLAEMRGLDVVIGWEALGSWDGQQTLITIDDVFSNLPGPFVIQNCVQIDVWSPDRAGEVAQAIWRATETIDANRLSAPKFIPNQGGRWSLDLEFRIPAERQASAKLVHAQIEKWPPG
jgi:hypothetical protein